MLKLEMIKKKAEVFFSDGSRLKGRFFVSPQAPNHYGEESVLEVLTGDREYVPFEVETADIVLLQRRAIVKVRMKEGDIGKDLPYIKGTSARVSLLSGEVIEGRLYLDLPESRSRLSDFFNDTKLFFHLAANGEDYLVNSRSVKIIYPDLSD